MTTEHGDVACKRIRDALIQDVLKRTEFFRVEKPPSDVYAFDPDGWEIYLIFKNNSRQVGGGEYWAYHPGLEQVRYLDVHGE